MTLLYDELTQACSKEVTLKYSTSFFKAVNLLSPTIQQDIHNIYGFVRFADEIVDTFHEHNQEELLNQFEKDFYGALKVGISLNPILNSFQKTVLKYDIDISLVDAFMRSMKMDLYKTQYTTKEEYEQYIYGSADVVGLMCLKVFVEGDQNLYESLKDSAMRLGSAFQKVNFLRDIKNDLDVLNRSYFPQVDLENLDESSKDGIIKEIQEDFEAAQIGIAQLPLVAKLGVYTAYSYYFELLIKLKKTRPSKLLETRIRVNNFMKTYLFCKSYLKVKFNFI
ncbi:phytoene/squalene synthase family protein [Cyclobacteriaceae bacterium]|nr:phytoene/squalene synthase family protein [Cyclobacteriaceae bacterium]